MCLLSWVWALLALGFCLLRKCHLGSTCLYLPPKDGNKDGKNILWLVRDNLAQFSVSVYYKAKAV